MKKTTLFGFIALGAIMFFGFLGCGNKEIKSSQLENSYWVLRNLNGNVARGLFDGPLPSMEFNFRDSIISGSSGCNRYFGKFSLDQKNKFSAPNLAGTLMACPFLNAESEFLVALSADNIQLALEKDTILSFRRNNMEILRFTKGSEQERNDSGKNMSKGESQMNTIPAAPVQPADKTQVVEKERIIRRKNDTGNKKATPEYMKGVWVLKGIANENVDEIFGDKRPTIDFKENGTLTGNAGCNNYRTTYKMEEHLLTISEIASTRMACPVMDGENRFINFMAEPVEAYLNMDDTALLFFRGDDLVLEFVRK